MKGVLVVNNLLNELSVDYQKNHRKGHLFQNVSYNDKRPNNSLKLSHVECKKNFKLFEGNLSSTE